MNKKVILAILDGWGIAPNKEVSAVDTADTPYIDHLQNTYPTATLRTDGMNVGLPDGQMGNSEVGHMNLGAGRIVYQDLVKINMAVEKDTLKEEPAIKDAFEYAKSQNKAVHLMGLVSDGGVHSHLHHLKGLVKAASDYGLNKTYVHAFTDGRDVDPKSGKGFIEDLLAYLDKHQSQLASVIGRYYAMDRDKRWERVKKAYDLIVHGKGTQTQDVVQAIQNSYDNNTTDEFIEPIVNTNNGEPISTVKNGDVVIFFNFRTDRGRQLTIALSQQNFPEQDMKALDLKYYTMTRYDDTFKNINVVYTKDNIKNTLGEVLAHEGKTQIRAAETEKYPHVTFFFSGGQETTFKGEKRILVNSPKVATYDLQPEMSAFELKDKVVNEIKNQSTDFMCVNFANPDMVGHTGVFEAAVKACETVDSCMKELVTTAQKNDYSVIIIADHGNSETMINPDGSPNTAHTTNPVPLILVDNDLKFIKSGILGDIAPTILKLMGIKQPDEMTQKALI
ncbi:2,3-bisphosphoglycerate-independent phosphoglycerate mutase [Mesohalobacter halotolerans]|uniref:2,3-bisphosphoglycerate-independent phosphoglycerate mutase n=1 Tax=Mesohalobacter halotolerans TaxID=1883405 RepID=A0A4U5TS94_9FLAO|nr:2,3-bisphosphoglycerate-independent phosphoglycerate mutase [Mesohalobacter halotolerans]TKS56721.1 2,3-bisphosphoglycerate-independent phosphoglycerate mutase [Mesohalobacter halotolerans]